MAIGYTIFLGSKHKYQSTYHVYPSNHNFVSTSLTSGLKFTTQIYLKHIKTNSLINSKHNFEIQYE